MHSVSSSMLFGECICCIDCIELKKPRSSTLKSGLLGGFNLNLMDLSSFNPSAKISYHHCYNSYHHHQKNEALHYLVAHQIFCAYNLENFDFIGGITFSKIIFLHSFEAIDSIFCVINVPLGLFLELL